MTIHIYLTQGQIALADNVDAPLAGLKWYAQFNSGYADGGAFLASRSVRQIHGGRRTELMHRVILSRVLGRELRRGEQVDHINGDTLDNRRGNLRLATASENQHNRERQVDNTSGFKGVGWHAQRKRWRARIKISDKENHLGLFDTAEEAARAYDAAARELHGEFARLNFPDGAEIHDAST